ncbi:hypothetical protein AB870_14250 [Pandoraea faecigallinarum]|uniref:Phosphonate metabolism protein n=1 Tax=Pandoraea faecigallinarum TaxID=656179 RepID=A0A0H3WS53_9BURK|nr:DUF1045 domain-containing protein [Pandoraea faecigallinarum]AKM31029.1 hypothetical protein AB870_14250 [Pandoraea faecigallinarum]
MTAGSAQARWRALDLRSARVAIYYAPPAGSCWWNEGSRWLGRDAASGRALHAPSVPGLSRSLHDLTAEPRRYGLHATLKAPMRLAPHAQLSDLSEIAATLAARHAPFDLVMHTDVIGTENGKRPGFVALRPKAGLAGEKTIDAFAAECVEAFEAMRAPLNEAELAKRNPHLLTSRQRELLDRWGYPYVFDEFRFHVTLSDRVDAADATLIVDWWQPRVQALGPMRVDGLAIFVQPAPGEVFHCFERFAFGKAA